MMIGLANRDGTVRKVLAHRSLTREHKLRGTMNKQGIRDNLEVYMANMKVIISREDFEVMRKFFEQEGVDDG
jgi:hypothetical protein